MQSEYNNIARSLQDRMRTLAAISFLLTICLLSACSKKEVNPPNPASILLLNAIDDIPYLSVIPSYDRPSLFKQGRILQHNIFNLKQNLLPIPSNSQSIMFFGWPDTLAKDEPVIKTTLEVERGALYSMILYGNRSAAKYYLHKDEIPRIATSDSLTQIRLANFSEEQSVGANLKNNPAGTFIQEVKQQSFSRFQTLPVLAAVNKYELEIRDVSDGALLLTYSMENINRFGNVVNEWLFAPVTLVLTGRRDGTGPTALKVSKMNHR